MPQLETISEFWMSLQCAVKGDNKTTSDLRITASTCINLDARIGSPPLLLGDASSIV